MNLDEIRAIHKTPSRRLGDEPTSCPHLGEPTGESTTIYSTNCCNSTVGVDASVWHCSLHQRCVKIRATSIADESIKLCAYCPDNPRKPDNPEVHRIADLIPRGK